MNIYLLRHFKVDFTWKQQYTSKGFQMACQHYDTAGIINQTMEFKPENVQVYVSELIRSSLTFKTLGMDMPPNKTALINEVPIAPFIETNIKLPTFIWMVVGRIQWFLNCKTQPEVRRDTLKKIKVVLHELETNKKDVLVIGHGFYFSQMKRVLKKNGYSGSGKSYYRNGDIVKFSKSNS